MLLFSIIADEVPFKVQEQNKVLDNLIFEISKENMQALELLYEKTKTAVYGFALSILRNPQNAEDVMQETYINVYNGASGYQSRGKPMAWILTIVRNLSLMKLRQGNRQETSLDEAQELKDSSNFEQTSIEHMILQTALTVLSEEERQIIILHSLSGLKHREIALILDIPLSTTLSKYHRGLAKLKKYIEKEER